MNFFRNTNFVFLGLLALCFVSCEMDSHKETRERIAQWESATPQKFTHEIKTQYIRLGTLVSYVESPLFPITSTYDSMYEFAYSETVDGEKFVFSMTNPHNPNYPGFTNSTCGLYSSRGEIREKLATLLSSGNIFYIWGRHRIDFNSIGIVYVAGSEEEAAYKAIEKTKYGEWSDSYVTFSANDITLPTCDFSRVQDVELTFVSYHAGNMRIEPGYHSGLPRGWFYPLYTDGYDVKEKKFMYAYPSDASISGVSGIPKEDAFYVNWYVNTSPNFSYSNKEAYRKENFNFDYVEKDDMVYIWIEMYDPLLKKVSALGDPYELIWPFEKK